MGNARDRRALGLVAGIAMAVAQASTGAGCGDDETGAAVGPSTTSSAGGSAGAAQGGSGGSNGRCTAPSSTRGSAVAISPDDSVLVTANRDAGTVTVLEVAHNESAPALTKKAEIAVGVEPWQVAVDACGERAFVVLRRDQKVVAIDDLTGSPARGAEAAVGSEPTALALSPNGTALYVANWVDGTVTVLDPVDLAVKETIDLNPVLADSGLLGPSVDATHARPALAHPRSIAVTNDGDDDDTDEIIAVTEFFAQRTTPEAEDGSNVDTNWIGLVYTIQAADRSVATIPLSALIDTGFDNHTGAETGCFPNQLQSLTVQGTLAYVTSICASPRGPVGAFQKQACANDAACTTTGSVCDPTVKACTLACAVDADCGSGAPPGSCALPQGACKPIPTNIKTMTHPVVHIVDLAQAGESGTVNLNAAFDAFYQERSTPDDASRRYPLVSNDIAFDPQNGDAYVIANGADAVFRVETDAAGAIVGVGASEAPFIDLASSASPELAGQSPIGIAAAHAGGYAFVASDVSRTVSVIDLAGQTLAGGAVASDAPTDPAAQSRARGKYAFNTGLGRWSHNGQAWSACQVCHFEGLSDNVTWYFARGPRQSNSLDGSFASSDAGDQRIFNWTAVFDEIEDFENVARGLNGAVGALVSTLSTPPVNSDRINLGDTTAFPPAGAVGLHGSAHEAHDESAVADWADIKAFIQAVRSPRAPSNLDAQQVTEGELLFVEGGACQGCHGGAKWTLSRRFYQPSGSTNAALLTTAYDGDALVAAGFPSALLPAVAGQQYMRGPSPTPGGNDQIQCVLRPVGTYGVSPAGVNVIEVKADMVSAAQGNGQDGKGFNVPSLLGLSVGAPYFHAGNARTLEELLDDLFAAHRDALGTLGTLGQSERDALVAFLLSIDEGKAPIALPAQPGAGGGDFCTAPP